MLNNQTLPFRYCDKYSLDHVWVNNGLNRCFITTVTTSVTAGIIFIFGTVQCLLYDKHATLIPLKYRPKTHLYSVQLILSAALALEAILSLILQDTVVGGKHIYGYMIYTCVANVISWSVSAGMLRLERTRIVPVLAMKGHGVVLLIFWSLQFIVQNLAFISWSSQDWWWGMKNSADYVQFSMWLVRYICTLCLFVLGLMAPGSLRPSQYQPVMIEEEQQDSPSGGSTWANVFKKLRLMLPYVWPKGSPLLQAVVVFCVLVLIAGRVINVYVPLYNKKIVDSLTVTQVDVTITTPRFRWDFILIWGTLKFLQGGGAGTTGFLNNIRSLAWIKVQQFTTRSIQIKLYSHIHALSLRWHLTKKTGEVLRIVDRGTNSINTLLSYVLFNVFPTIADIIIAVIYFVTTYNYIFGVVVFVCMLFYLFFTIYITEWRTKFRREMNIRDNEMNSRAVDSLLNFETVKYYGASDFEISRYREAILSYQKAEFKSTGSLNVLNMIQNFVVTIGLLTGSLLAAWAVVHGFDGMVLTVGDYVQFGTYLLQLYGPLNFLGTYYRMIQQAFVDMENMFDLLDKNQEVKDSPDAKDLVIKSGGIEFNHVSFHYQPEKPILKDITFSVPAGETYALVGNSGGGKSTVIRLLFRFYDIQSGEITIDGQDISKVRQESLRKAIGVVPQDTVLFNNNIMYNVRYGRVGAADSDIFESTQASDIHERILSFPSGYDTMVGERGLKLSGGEKQRIAIARTMLKAPVIVLLDEATSALDTHTERNIQASLNKVCENRTTIIVAHRLSTIVHANCILVLNEGEIVERGTHDELMEKGGIYMSLWLQQTQTNAETNNDVGE